MELTGWSMKELEFERDEWNAVILQHEEMRPDGCFCHMCTAAEANLEEIEAEITKRRRAK